MPDHSRYQLKIRLDIQEYGPTMGYTGNSFNVSEDLMLPAADSFLAIAAVLGRFHDLAKQIEAETTTPPLPAPKPLVSRYLEEDRYLVLLDCGHWIQTRWPSDLSWYCEECGPGHTAGAARTPTGERAVLTIWDLYDGCPRPDDQEHDHAMGQDIVAEEQEGTPARDAETALISWAAIDRNQLVRAALDAGLSKTRIHTITGIARTTINRIQEADNA